MSEGSAQAEQRKKVLAAVLGALLLVLVWRFVVPSVERWLDRRAKQGQVEESIASTLAIANSEVVIVDLGEMEAEAGVYEPKRNIFRFGEKPKPAPPPPPPPPPPRIEKDPGPPPPPPPPPPPRPPEVTFQLLGIFGPENRRIAALVDGPEIINALEAEVLKEQFIINEIGFESVEIGFVGFPESETQRLEMGARSSTSRRR
jgi:hypothetical protein